MLKMATTNQVAKAIHGGNLGHSTMYKYSSLLDYGHFRGKFLSGVFILCVIQAGECNATLQILGKTRLSLHRK